jgi:hypothetical protein
MQTGARILGSDGSVDGFTDHPSGEDRFDAVLGLIAMVAVVAGEHPSAVPDTREVKQLEGWILGQPVDG